jgi:predicted MFS family arabinose efflux permease
MTDITAPPPLRHNRDFRLLWIGHAVSELGSSISTIAYPLLVLALTGSAADAGVVGFLGMLPFAALQLPAGALVDRWDRKRVMLLSDAVRALTVAIVALAVATDNATILLLSVAAFTEGAFSVFFVAAEPGALRHIVPEPQLAAAMAQNEARSRGSRLLGKPIGGVLFGLGHTVPFAIDAISYAASFLCLNRVDSRFNEEREAPQQHILADIREGVVWLWRQPFLRACILLVAGSNFMFQGYTLAIVVLAEREGASAAQIGVMLGGFGGGGLLGALAAPWLQPRIPPWLVVVGANWVWTALVPLALLIDHPYAIAVMAGGMAFVGPIWNVVIGSYEIRLTPEALLSRVASVAGLIAIGVIPFGSLVAGFLLEGVGPRTTILLLTLLMVAISIAGTVNRHIRSAPPPD